MEKGRRPHNYVSPLLQSGKPDTKKPLIQFDEGVNGNGNSNTNTNTNTATSNHGNINPTLASNMHTTQNTITNKPSQITKKPVRKDTETILRELLSGNEFYMAQFKKELPESGREFSVGITRLLNFLHGCSEVVDEVGQRRQGQGQSLNENEVKSGTLTTNENNDHTKDECNPDSSYDLTIDIKFTCELKDTDFIGKNDKNYRIHDVPVDIFLFYNVLDILIKEGKITDVRTRYVNDPSLEKLKKVKGFLYATHEVPLFKQIMFTVKKVYFMKHFIIEGNDDPDLYMNEVKDEVNVW